VCREREQQVLCLAKGWLLLLCVVQHVRRCVAGAAAGVNGGARGGVTGRAQSVTPWPACL
jgi:hypothetical protein